MLYYSPVFLNLLLYLPYSKIQNNLPTTPLITSQHYNIAQLSSEAAKYLPPYYLLQHSKYCTVSQIQTSLPILSFPLYYSKHYLYLSSSHYEFLYTRQLAPISIRTLVSPGSLSSSFELNCGEKLAYNLPKYCTNSALLPCFDQLPPE